MKKRNLLGIITIMLLAIGLSACGDRGTSTEAGEPPIIPQLGEVLTPDISYFNNNPQKAEIMAAVDNFNSAKSSAFFAVSLLSFGHVFSTTYFEIAKNKDAAFVDGSWVWEYSYSADGVSASFKLTATENTGDGSVYWELFVSSSNDELNIDNYKFMEGTVAADGSSGTWQMNAFEPDSEAKFSFEWIINGTNNRTLTSTIYDENGVKTAEFTYQQNDDIFEISVESDNDAPYIIHWNISSGAGYFINTDGVKRCWNGNYQNVACS